MWSATWPREVEQLAIQYCNVMPVQIKVGEEGITANAKIKQVIEFVDQRDKYYK
mgnify:CR=1 FL=1